MSAQESWLEQLRRLEDIQNGWANQIAISVVEGEAVSPRWVAEYTTARDNYREFLYAGQTSPR